LIVLLMASQWDKTLVLMLGTSFRQEKNKSELLITVKYT
jgi:hypothetical protein